jgi:hypothetical protein
VLGRIQRRNVVKQFKRPFRSPQIDYDIGILAEMRRGSVLFSNQVQVTQPTPIGDVVKTVNGATRRVDFEHARAGLAESEVREARPVRTDNKFGFMHKADLFDKRKILQLNALEPMLPQ